MFCQASRLYLVPHTPEEEAAAATAKAEVDAAAAAAATAATNDNEDLPPSLKGKTTFTQAELNLVLAENKRRAKSQVEKQIRELEMLKKSQTLTEKDKKDLQTRIDEMSSTLLTKEELARKERERLESTHKANLQSVTEERNAWQNRFTKSTINSAIIGEAVRSEAFDPDSLIAILGPNTRLVENVDADGKGTDEFIAKVKFSDVNEEGHPIALDLTVPEVVKRMKELPKYGYLFKSTATGGLGTPPNPAAGSKVDVSKMTPAQYREHRKKSGLVRKS